jgi:signal transduction histidine kinase
METVDVLLIDTTDSFKSLLEGPPLGDDSLKFIATLVKPTSLKEPTLPVSGDFRVILFGEKVGAQTVVRYARKIRSSGVMAPMFVLTKNRETMVPRKFQKAGIDEMLNVAEMKTPLFSWTFMSTLKQTENRRKANEFEDITSKLKSINESLGFITHEINNPLSVIRLAIYHLENMELSSEKRKMLFKLLNENIDKVDMQMDELRTLRKRLSNGQQSSDKRSLVHSSKGKLVTL